MTGYGWLNDCHADPTLNLKCQHDHHFTDVLGNASNVGKMLLILLNPLGAYRLNIFGRIVKQTIKSLKKSLILFWLPNMTIMM